MHKSLLSVFACTLALAVAVPARAWEPMPLDASQQTSVVRVLDTALIERSGQLLVALTELPGGICAANGALRTDAAGHPLTAFDESWVFVDTADPGRSLAFLMGAKAQNMSIRVVLSASRGNPCRITDMRTCTDATACAVPGLPGN